MYIMGVYCLRYSGNGVLPVVLEILNPYLGIHIGSASLDTLTVHYNFSILNISNFKHQLIDWLVSSLLVVFFFCFVLFCFLFLMVKN